MPREFLARKTMYNYEDATNKRFCSARPPNVEENRNTRRGRNFKWCSSEVFAVLPRYENRPKKIVPRYALMDLLKEINDASGDSYKEETLAVSFARKHSLLSASPKCACGGMQTTQRHKNGVTLRCKICQSRCSPYKLTILQDSHLGMNKPAGFLSSRLGLFLVMLYCWSRGLTVTQTTTEVGLSAQTVSVWFKLIRQAIVDHVDTDELFQRPLGGPGSIVEIDEAMLYHSMFNKGRAPEGFAMGSQDYEPVKLDIKQNAELLVDNCSTDGEIFDAAQDIGDSSLQHEIQELKTGDTVHSVRAMSSLRQQQDVYYGENQDDLDEVSSIAVDDYKDKPDTDKIDSQVWVFGAIDYFSGHCKFQLLENRKAETLIPLIEQWISPGSSIWSDGWKAYRNIENHPSYYFDWVNHQERYVNPDGVNTNLVERLWSSVRAIIPPTARAEEKGIYLKEAWFRLMYRKSDIFFVALRVIGDTVYS